MAALAALTAFASAAAPYAAVASTALGAAGAIQESRAGEAAAEMTARQYEMKRKADLASSTVQAERTRKEADRLISKQRAIAAASGAGTGGSAAEIMANTAAAGEFNSAMDMWLGNERAASDRYAGQMALAEAKAKRRALPFNVGASVLSGLSSVASKAPIPRSVSPFTTTIEPYYG